MAITKNPTAADAEKPYTVTRAFYWAGEVVGVGTVLQLTNADSAPLLAANKLTPGEPAPDEAKAAKPAKASKADKAEDADKA